MNVFEVCIRAQQEWELLNTQACIIQEITSCLILLLLKAPSLSQVKTIPNFFHDEICGSVCHKNLANLKK